MKDIFISFSSKETDKAIRTCEFLEENGFTCFISTRDLVGGREYAEQLFDNLDNSRMVLLLLSKEANDSPHVLREIEYAVRKKLPVLVYSLEEVKLSKSMEYYLMTHQWITPQSNVDTKLLEGISQTLETEKPVKIIKPKTSVPVLPIAAGVMLLLLLLVILIPKKTDKSDTESTSVAATETSPANSSSISEATTEAQISTNATTEAEATSEVPKPAYKIGDIVAFGKYYYKEIEWKVIDIDSEGNLTLLSKDILTMKAFDAAEGGEYNKYKGVDYFLSANNPIKDEEIQVMARGNNDWSLSNIRAWLNSKDEVVKYDDQAPDKKASGMNYYDMEAGFLKGFTEEEISSIIPVTNKTTGNKFSKNADENGLVETTDLVYLLSLEEYEKLPEKGISPYAVPNSECQAHDYYNKEYLAIAKDYNDESYFYLLRDNPGTDCYKVYAANIAYFSDDPYTTVSAGISNYGIRPVIKIKAPQ